ncbi:MAG TPA: pseudaminic acid cytidylyltransferase [Parafilimonas sp.]|jgi:pseudaminic acid cytidylyltransferase|nr:pseudaminic acid cytidylyltransferase [Parafilimonas sp.]
MSNIAIIPARGGSKRIPRKNIKEFCGKPIIAYSIEAALKSNLFSEIMVSTEDEEIAEISIKHEAKVPFFRSMKNADDFTGPGDVIYEVLNEYKSRDRIFDNVCCIYATAPLISHKRLIEGYNLLTNSDFDLVFPVAKFNYPIWRSFKINKDSQAEMNFPEHETKRSQDLSDAFHDAGQFYWLHSANMHTLKNKNVLGYKKGAIILDDVEVQDIDTLNDWVIAEIKFNYLKDKIR